MKGVFRGDDGDCSTTLQGEKRYVALVLNIEVVQEEITMLRLGCPICLNIFLVSQWNFARLAFGLTPGKTSS